MTHDLPAEDNRRRAPWVMTLADLFMLIVGFFVFLQANTALDAKAIGDGIRDGFGATAPAADVAPLTLEMGAITGFAAGSATIANDPAPAIAWAITATADPRTVLTVTGQTDGSGADVDPATGSAAILAADRARVAAALLADRLGPDRLRIATATGTRSTTLHVGFIGQKDPHP